MMRPAQAPFGRPQQFAAIVVLAAAAVGLFVAEKRQPFRAKTQREPRRTLRNLALGALSLGVAGGLENPLVKPLAALAERRRTGLIQQLPVSAAARDLLALLTMDYTIYLWHVATHRVPFLWRFHLVHHLDLDLDTTTALFPLRRNGHFDPLPRRPGACHRHV